MKKIFIAIAAAALCLSVCTEASARNIPRQRIVNAVNGFRSTDGFEVVNIGRFGTWLISTAAHLSGEAAVDAETAEAVKILDGIKRLLVVDYEEASERESRIFSNRISSALKGCDLLMSANDEESSVNIYGTVDTDGRQVRDLVVFTPDDGALVCVFGSFSMDDVARLANM